ncbi:TIGR02099 family protein [Ramlibacter henchirensis]|uniref:TIGR02099 family protein n=1 Tax=Ramlibacter henchirensis TaxID=204072 RepID=A0A4Z0C792_9BURK|nr:YhdP family protein [Ramlibacter henchirensis]TFZ06854.1 TIGR02099 family protein [Ramlibacter henchirensis]
MNDSPPLPSGPLKLYAAVANGLLWLLAAAWLLLALAWGAVHGWIVPRIGDFRPVLETRATQLLGVPVRIGAISARSEGLVPSFQLESVVLLDPQGREALSLPRVVASLSPRSLLHLGFDQLYIDSPVLDVRRSAQGRLVVAGLELAQGQEDDGRMADWFFRQREFVIRGGTVRWTDEMLAAPPLQLEQVDFVVRNTSRRHAIRLDATPPPAWGDRFTVQAAFRQPFLSAHPGRWQDWDGQLHADFHRVDLGELRKHTRLGFEVHGGHGAVRAWVDVADGKVTGAVADLAAAGVSTTLRNGLAPLALATVSGRLGGRLLPGGLEVEARELQFTTAEGQRWPAGNVFFTFTEPDGRREGAGELRADRVDLGALGQVASALPLGEATHAALARHAPRGIVENLIAKWQGPLPSPARYQARGRVTGLQIAAVPASVEDGHATGALPGVRNASLDFDLNEAGGKARLSLNAGELELPGVFQEPVLAFDRLSGDLQWQLAGERITVNVANLRFANADAQGEGQASWRTGDQPAHRYPGVLDLQASLLRAKGARVWRYLPLGVPQDARDYVREAVQQGDVADARFRVRGDLKDFPFPQRQGDFLVTAQVRNATYAFAPRSVTRGPLQWPALSQLSARLVFDRTSLRIEDAQGRLTGAPNLRVKASAQIPDLSQAVVGLDGEIRGPLAEALGVVQRSPISALMNDTLARSTANGNTEVKLGLELPIEQIQRSRVQGTVTLAGNDVQITPDSPPLQRARGSVLFSERGFQLVGTQARALGGDMRIEGGSRPGGAEPSVVLRAQGTATAEGLRQARELGFVSRLAKHATGASSYSAVLSFRRGTPEVQVTSSLQGLALSLPAPLSKPAEAAMPLRYENVLLAADASGPMHDQLSVDIGRVASVTYVRDVSGAEPKVLRGSIAIGLAQGESASLPDQGVTANVRLGSTNVDAWEQVFEGGAPATAAAPASAPAAAAPARPASAAAALGYLPTTIALRAKELTVEGRTLHNLVVGGSRDGLLWRGNVDADELNGYVEYRQPAGSGAGRVHARLARLSIAASTANAVETLLDEQPASMPALDVVVEDFELRGRKLGRLEIDAVNRGGAAVVREGGIREWRLNKLALITPEGTFSATGNWAAVDAQAAPPGGPRPPRTPPERRRTVMNFRLDIGDAGQLLTRVGMKDVVRRGQGRMEGQVAWLGSPLAFDYPSMQGFFHVDVQAGQFLKADPGLAKLLGVLSLQSLPRRLALDFRDVFSQGFAFDFVRGDITIQNGVAATNNLQMKGVNAAVLMEGKADIARETQDLRVVVVPEINAGTASLVAAVINPAIGLGTFLAQVFLREPLARAATQQFQIEGTWADPRVTKLARQSAAGGPPQEQEAQR